MDLANNTDSINIGSVSLNDDNLEPNQKIIVNEIVVKSINSGKFGSSNNSNNSSSDSVPTISSVELANLYNQVSKLKTRLTNLELKHEKEVEKINIEIENLIRKYYDLQENMDLINNAIENGGGNGGGSISGSMLTILSQSIATEKNDRENAINAINGNIAIINTNITNHTNSINDLDKRLTTIETTLNIRQV